MAVVGSVGVVVRPITTGLSGSLKRAFSGASGAARGAGAEAGQAYGAGMEREAPNAIQRFGSSLVSAMGRLAKGAAVVGGTAVGAAVGASVIGGFRSAINQQQGQLVLSGLYGEADKARKTLEGLRGVASGSPIDYSGYQSAAESLAYAGVEGDQAIGVLENVGKAITAAGGDTSNMDRASDALLRGVNAGRFQLDTLQQLSDAGIPILSGLADHFGVSMEEVNKMASNGQVQLDDVLAVMENGTGAIFQQMITAGESASTSFGNQWKIAKDNIVTAIGGQMVPMLETLAPIIGEVGEKISTWITGLDFTPVTNAVSGIVGWVQQLDFSSWKRFTDSLAGGGASSAFSSITDSLADLGPAFSDFVDKLKESGPAVAQLAGGGLDLLSGALSFLAEHMDKIIAAIPYILAGFAAWRVAVQAQTTMIAIQAPIFALSNGMRLAAALLELRMAGATTTATAATGRQTVAQRINTVATKAGSAAKRVAAGAARLFGTALRFAMGPIGLIITGITLLVAGLVWFFTQTEVGQRIWETVWGAIKNAAGAVVDWFMGTALPVLQAAWDGIAAGALWLYENAILPAWNGIRAAVGAVGDWITGTLWPAIQTAWDAIGTAAMWLYENIIQPVWTGIKTAIAIAVTAILLYVDYVVFMWQNVFAPVAMWLYETIIVPVWNGIKTVIGAVASWIVEVAWPLIKSAWDAIAAAATWLYESVILPVWNAIKGAIKTVIDWIQNRGWPALKLTIELIGDIMVWLYENVVLPTWNAVKSAIDAVVLWFQNTAWPIIDTVIGWIQMAFEGWKIILGAIWDFVKNRIINPVITWFRDTAWPLIDRVLGYIETGFGIMRDHLGRVWDFIKNRIINPVATWFRDTVGPLFDTATSGIEDAFNTMKDAIKKAWDAIRDTAKVPVEFVVDKIINQAIIGNYNKVADTFEIDTIDPVSLPSGWRRGGILPGQSSWRDGDDQLIAARRGEGILVSEGLRDRKSQSMFLAANRAARTMGTSFADFVAGGFAGGGLVNLRMPFNGSYPRGDGFGARGGAHKGIDWPMPSGALLKAVAAGTANRTYNSAAGNKLELAIGNGLVAGYHHLSSFIARQGQSVGSGANVGRVGSTGRSTGPHLHFSLKRDGSYVDPAPYLGAGGEAGSDGGGWNPFAGLWDSLKDKVREGVGDNAFGDLLFEVPKKLVGGALEWVTDKITAIGDFASDVVSGAAGRARWLPVASQALRMTGNSGVRNLNSLLNRMGQESSFDPRAINNWDSNAKRGTPSKGLMQVIGPTFRAYRDSRAPNDIWNPLANILASIHYTDATYSSLRAGWNRSGGYAEGGIVPPKLFDTGGVLPPGLTSVLNASGKPEAVLTHDQWQQLRVIADGRGGGDQPRILIEQLSALDADDAVRKLHQKDHQVRAHYGPGVMV